MTLGESPTLKSLSTL